MPTAGGFSVLDNFTFALGVKAFIILFLVFYTVFALILQKQVKLLSKKLPTPLTPHLRFAATLNIGVSIALLFLVLGLY